MYRTEFIKLQAEQQEPMLRFVYCFLLCLLSACTFDKLPMPPENTCDGVQATYELNIRQIIEETCAYSGCHLEYTDYEGLLPVLRDGSFQSRVITLRSDGNLGMPPDYAPGDRPVDLSPEQLNLIRCWLSSEYPEN